MENMEHDERNNTLWSSGDLRHPTSNFPKSAGNSILDQKHQLQNFDFFLTLKTYSEKSNKINHFDEASHKKSFWGKSNRSSYKIDFCRIVKTFRQIVIKHPRFLCFAYKNKMISKEFNLLKNL